MSHRANGNLNGAQSKRPPEIDSASGVQLYCTAMLVREPLLHTARGPRVAKRVSITWVLLLLVGFAAHAAVEVHQNQHTEDFGYFYRAASAMLEGRDIYTAAGGRYIYPPFIAFIFQPLALLPEVTAAMVWAAISAALLLAALLILANEAASRWLRPDRREDSAFTWIIAAAVLTLLADKIHAMFTLGQTDTLMLLAFACAFRWMERRPILAGLVIGTAANIKYLSVIAVPYFLLKRNYRAAAAACGAFVLLMLLPIVQVGPERLGQYTGAAFGGLGRMMGFDLPRAGAKVLRVDWDRSISLTSAAFRQTRARGLPDAVAIASIATTAATMLGALVFVAWRQRVRIFALAAPAANTADARLTSLEWAVLVFLAVAFSPQTTTRHMILLSLVLAVAVGVFLAVESRVHKAAVIGGVVLLLAGLSLPLGTLGFHEALRQWRLMSGASWCAFLLLLAVVWAGSRAISDENHTRPGET